MGQQQLLLIILVTIIIGFAVVLAINIMHAAQKDANRSAVRQDMLMVLNDAQLYYLKSAALGGGNNSFDGISLSHIQSIDPVNENGSYEVSGSADSVTVKGRGRYDDILLTVSGSMSSGGMDVRWSEPAE